MGPSLTQDRPENRAPHPSWSIAFLRATRREPDIHDRFMPPYDSERRANPAISHTVDKWLTVAQSLLS